jgi:hypothetical protein
MRDEEWDRAKQPPVWLMVLAVIIVTSAFFAGVYAEKPHSTIGWVIGALTIAIYMLLGSLRRRRARRYLRAIHGQAVS